MDNSSSYDNTQNTHTQDFAANRQAALPTEQQDLARREATSARTLLGRPSAISGIPSHEDTQQQLEAVRTSELPAPASKTAHRESNYAPGYESAAAAVPHRVHGEEGHNPKILSHECLHGQNNDATQSK